MSGSSLWGPALEGRVPGPPTASFGPRVLRACSPSAPGPGRCCEQFGLPRLAGLGVSNLFPLPLVTFQAGRGERWDVCLREVWSVRMPPHTCACGNVDRPPCPPQGVCGTPPGVWEPRASRRRWRSPVCAPRRGPAGVSAVCVSVVSNEVKPVFTEAERSPLQALSAHRGSPGLGPRPLRFGGPPPRAFGLGRGPSRTVLTGLGLRSWVLPWPLALCPRPECRRLPALSSDAWTSFSHFTDSSLEIWSI